MAHEVALCFSSVFLQEVTCSSHVDTWEADWEWSFPELMKLHSCISTSCHSVYLFCLILTKVKLYFSSCTPRKHWLWVYLCVCVHMFVYVCGMPLSSRKGKLHASLLLCQHLLPTGGNASEKLSRCWFRIVQTDRHSHDVSLCTSMFLIIISQDWRVVKGQLIGLAMMTHLLWRSLEVRISGWMC